MYFHGVQGKFCPHREKKEAEGKKWRRKTFPISYFFLSMPYAHVTLHNYVLLQNQEMIAEGDLASAMDQSNKIREMQDKISNLRAQVYFEGIRNKVLLSF